MNDDVEPWITIEYMFESNGNKPIQEFYYSGPLIMSKPTPSTEAVDALKKLVGDSNTKVTVGRDFAKKTYGNGGSLLVSVSLTCNQDENTIAEAIQKAYAVVSHFGDYYTNAMMDHLASKGLI